MSFVGTRPEAVKYVEKYKPEYMATLLLPAGITSEASIRYKDEAEFFDEEVPENPLKAEYLIPTFIGKLLEQEKIQVKVLRTDDTWYGMTYK